MGKTLLYHLFKAGSVPGAERAALESEGILVEDEGLSATATYIDYRAPWKRYAWRRTWFSGSVVLTRERLVAFAFSRRLVSVPRADAAARKVEVGVEDDGRLLLAFEASRFSSEQSGRVELRFATDHADRVVEKLRGR